MKRYKRMSLASGMMDPLWAKIKVRRAFFALCTLIFASTSPALGRGKKGVGKFGFLSGFEKALWCLPPHRPQIEVKWMRTPALSMRG
jgi:hypothetical protein